MPDTIRYTFQYREARYTQGVWTDIERLKGEGFKLHTLKNSWSDDQYKGINSQWIEPETGQRFEVQFHTRISFEAKQLTHTAYERLRTKQADEFEELVLEAFQKKVTADVPVPPGAADIPDYRRGAQMPERSPTTQSLTTLAVVSGLPGVFRRTYFEVGGRRDEAFTTDLVWERSASLVSAERGDLQNEFIEITEEEANQIVARIRADVTGASST